MLIYILLFSAMSGHAFAADKQGSMRFNTAKKNYEFFDGSNWHLFSAVPLPLSSCSKQAEMNYNSLLKAYEICTGTSLKLASGLPTLTLCSETGVVDFRSGTLMFCNGLVWVDLRGPLSYL